MEVNYNYFPNLGYILSDVPSNLLEELKVLVTEKELQKHNVELAGNIKKEFFLPKAVPIFQDYILHLCKLYDDEFNYLGSIDPCTNAVPFVLKSMWVNFQKKYEFNPMHVHSGIFSFVIWLQVPFYMKEEQDNSPGKESNSNVAGCFEFDYANILGGYSSHYLHVDKNWEGKICLFPSKLNHAVNPFYSSEEYRITVSGNVSLKT